MRALTNAIRSHEAPSGDCTAVGLSGERGCFQWLPDTWAAASTEALGYVAPITDNTEYYVALYRVNSLMARGYDADDVARTWNQGNAGPCVRGVNKWGVRYDSCAYEKAIMAKL